MSALLNILFGIYLAITFAVFFLGYVAGAVTYHTRKKAILNSLYYGILWPLLIVKYALK